MANLTPEFWEKWREWNLQDQEMHRRDVENYNKLKEEEKAIDDKAAAKEVSSDYSFTFPKLPAGSYSVKVSSSDGVVVTDSAGKVVHLVNPAEIPAFNNQGLDYMMRATAQESVMPLTGGGEYQPGSARIVFNKYGDSHD